MLKLAFVQFAGILAFAVTVDWDCIYFAGVGIKKVGRKCRITSKGLSGNGEQPLICDYNSIQYGLVDCCEYSPDKTDNG